ncbi:hypothetical protein DBR17_14785 [Sphingomonas sp. HMWF008]|nr:hypothetical protein DBR17_14785 [Sphingomonas sp. HMWF008]
MLTKPSGDPSGLGGKRLTELFAAQQRFIGAMAGATAPVFSETWTSDRDLGAPDRRVLEVAVLLTRRQLNELATQTEYLLRIARNGQTESSTFFDLLQMVSAATSQDPRRFGGDSARMGALLPTFLELLPYRSEVLELTAKEWRDMQAQKQAYFIGRLQQKLQGYRRTEADQRQWVALGSNDAGEALALVRLEDLP